MAPTTPVVHKQTTSNTTHPAPQTSFSRIPDKRCTVFAFWGSSRRRDAVCYLTPQHTQTPHIHRAMSTDFSAMMAIGCAPNAIYMHATVVAADAKANGENYEFHIHVMLAP